MLKHEDPTFLDDMTVEAVEKSLKITIRVISSPDDFVKTLVKG